MYKVLITGASRGLGLSLGQKLIKMGFKVFCLSRTKPDSNFVWIKCNLEKTSELVQLFFSEDELKDIDIVINNAGVLRGYMIENLKMDNIIEVMNINLISPFYITSYYASSWMESKKKYGRIINIGSSAEDIGHPDLTYSVSKLGLRGLTFSLSKLFSRYGNLTINHFNLGPMKTKITKNIEEANMEYLRSKLQIVGGYLDIDLVVKTIVELIDKKSVINGQLIRLHDSTVAWKHE